MIENNINVEDPSLTQITLDIPDELVTEEVAKFFESLVKNRKKEFTASEEELEVAEYIVKMLSSHGVKYFDVCRHLRNVALRYKGAYLCDIHCKNVQYLALYATEKNVLSVCPNCDGFVHEGLYRINMEHMTDANMLLPYFEKLIQEEDAKYLPIDGMYAELIDLIKARVKEHNLKCRFITYANTEKSFRLWYGYRLLIDIKKRKNKPNQWVRNKLDSIDIESTAVFHEPSAIEYFDSFIEDEGAVDYVSKKEWDSDHRWFYLVYGE